MWEKMKASGGKVYLTVLTKEFLWEANELSEIRVGHSGMSVNDIPVNELQIVDADGKKALGLLGQLDDQELRWIRAKLSQALWEGTPS